jgi:ATP-dependent DNA helicase RecQ
LRGEQGLALALPPPRRERRQQAGGRGGSSTDLADAIGDLAVDADLLANLKNWRRDQAREQGVPPYVVFHDRTLLELAARQPASLAELGQVSGIGSAKLDRYGEAVLAVITTSCRQETSRTS